MAKRPYNLEIFATTVCVFIIAALVSSFALAEPPSCQKLTKRLIQNEEVFGSLTELMRNGRSLRRPTWRDLGFKDVAEISSKELGILDLKQSDFQDLSLLDRKSLESLESRLRPVSGSQSDYVSSSGFIGSKERLFPLLRQDSRFVASKGLSHQQIAEPLIRIRSFLRQHRNKMRVDPAAIKWRKKLDKVLDSGDLNLVAHVESDDHMVSFYPFLDFKYNGSRFRATLLNSKGTQYSPFNDGVEDASTFIILNLDNGKSLVGAFLVADLIERYGFYEGIESPYRIDPNWIIEVFELESQQQQL